MFRSSPIPLRALVAAIVAAVACLSLSPATASTALASGTVLQVAKSGQPYSTIQSAVNAASNGDTIEVAAGTYTENVKVTKYVSIVGAGSDKVTIQAPTNSVLSALFIQGVPAAPGLSTVISGLTITNGGTMSQSGQGGGVTIDHASPILHDDIIEKSAASQYGGGILINGNSNPLLYNLTVRNNLAQLGGGGIFVGANSAPAVVSSTVANNMTVGWNKVAGTDPNGGSSGAGIYLYNTSATNVFVAPIILNDTISNNTADFAGGGMWIGTGINAIVQGNTISGNTASYGGGIHIESIGSSPVIDSNTISGNSATAAAAHSGSGHGGGISIYNQSKPTIENNTISDNTSESGGAGILSAESANSIITGNQILRNSVKSSTNSRQGGGMLVINSTVVATNNVFASNQADFGGAVYVETGSTNATLANNTIVNNAESTSPGGAIHVDSGVGTVLLANNLLTHNQNAQIYDSSAQSAHLVNNLFGNSSAPGQTAAERDYSQDNNNNVLAENLGTVNASNTGNKFTQSVAFTNYAGGDFSLTSSSTAAINLGTSSLGGSLTIPVDIRGVARTAPYDAGAYEYVANPVVASSPVLSGTPQVSQSLSVSPGTGWGLAPSTLSYQWLSDGAPVAGETGSSYSPHLSDVGNALSVTVTATYYGVYSRSITTPVTDDVTRGPFFADVPFSSQFSTYVEWMAANGISTGTPNPPYAPLYKPADAVSRGAFAAFLYRVSGASFTPPADPTFADVDSTSPFFTAIEWMAAHGISTGTTQTSGKPLFAPAGVVSRQSMALFLARYEGVDTTTPPTTQTFADVPVTASSAAAINWMAQSNVSTGTAQPTGLPLYKPADPVSRQAMAAFLYRLPPVSKP